MPIYYIYELSVKYKAIMYMHTYRRSIIFLCKKTSSSSVFFFRGTLAYSAARELEASLKAVQYLLIFASMITSLGLLRSVLLVTESLLLVGDDSTIFQGV